ncbi:MAG: hypothetical protein QXP27_09665, partial [Candidatus Methanomethyliaceae archaeon]
QGWSVEEVLGFQHGCPFVYTFGIYYNRTLTRGNKWAIYEMGGIFYSCLWCKGKACIDLIGSFKLARKERDVGKTGVRIR